MPTSGGSFQPKVGQPRIKTVVGGATPPTRLGLKTKAAPLGSVRNPKIQPAAFAKTRPPSSTRRRSRSKSRRRSSRSPAGESSRRHSPSPSRRSSSPIRSGSRRSTRRPGRVLSGSPKSDVPAGSVRLSTTPPQQSHHFVKPAASVTSLAGGRKSQPPPASENPVDRASAWFAVPSEKLELYQSPERRGRPIHSSNTPPVHDGPPEFLSQQWSGGDFVGNSGWWQNESVQKDIVTGTLRISSMNLSDVPESKHRKLEEKSSIDIARLFNHPPWLVSVNVASGSILLKYKLELPEPGPSAATVISRAAAEMGQQTIRLPELEKEYRIATGADVPAIIDFDTSKPPQKYSRSHAMEPESTNQHHNPNGPIEIRSTEGKRKMQMVGPHTSFDGGHVWPELPIKPPPLPATVAAAVRLVNPGENSLCAPEGYTRSDHLEIEDRKVSPNKHHSEPVNPDVLSQCEMLTRKGADAHEKKDFNGSINYHSRLLELLNSMSHDVMPNRMNDIARVCSMLGNAHWAQSNWEMALSFHGRRLDIAETQNDKRGMGAAYGNLGNVYHAMGDYRAAVQYHLKHQQCVSAEDMQTMSAVFHNLGLAQFGSNEIDDALDSYRHSLEIATSLQNYEQAAKVHGNLSLAYRAKGKLQEAVNQLHLQLKAELKINNSDGGAATCLSIGNIYVSQSDYKNAIQYFERGLDLMKWYHHSGDIRKPDLATKLLIALGSCRFHLRQVNEAVSELTRALQLAEQVGNPELLSAAHSNLGLCYQQLEDFPKSLLHQKEQLRIAQEIGNRTSEGAAHGNLGNTFKSMGEYNKALDHYESDLGIALQTGDQMAQGQALDNLGLTCQALGEFPLAVDYHKKSLRILQSIGHTAGEGEAHAHIGTAYDHLGEVKLSIQHHHSHLDISKQSNDLESQGRAYGALGKACHEFKMYQKAIDYQLKRLAIAKQLGDSQAETRACGHLFVSYSTVGDHRSAEQYRTKHQEMCRMHGMNTIEETNDGCCHIRREIADALRDPHDSSMAAKRLMMLADSPSFG